MSDDLFKNATKFFREQFSEKVKSSHSHAVISAYCGYKSKKAFIDSETDVDENFILQVNPDLETLKECVARMNDSPLKTVPLPTLERLIITALTPACECCDEKKYDVQPIGDIDPYWNNCPDGWVCKSCASQYDDYARCRFCDDGVIHRAENINKYGECSIHEGESSMDEEEEQDWDDYIEYMTKDN